MLRQAERHRVPPAGWFIDADVLGLYHVLHAARRSSTDDVVSGLSDDFAVDPRMGDVEWMPIVAGQGGLAIITKDARQRFRPAERLAIEELGLGMFALRSRRPLTTWDQARMVFHHWQALEDAWDETDRPFVYTLTRTGGLRRRV